MSLEQALAANTEALNRVAVLLQGANIATNPAAPVIPQPQQQTYTPPVQQAPPMTMPGGMPPAPFPGAGSVGLPPRPFNDALGLLDWAKKKYDTLGATPGYAEKFGAVIQQHGLVNITDAQPNQFDSLYAAISALG